MLETTGGTLIGDSNIIMQFASDYGAAGLELIPKNPFEAAELRLKILAYDEIAPNFNDLYSTRGKDAAVIAKFSARLPAIEAFVKEQT